VLPTLSEINQQKQEDPPNWLESEFGFSYRALIGLLHNPRYAEAFRALWLAGLSAGGPDADMVREGNRDPWIRERLRLSMVLGERQPSGSRTQLEPHSALLPLGGDGGAAPFEAPCCFRDKRDCREYQLHPRFLQSGERDRLVLENLIRNELLPNYSLGDAFSLAALMTNRDTQSLISYASVLPWMCVLFLVGFLVAALSLLGALPASLNAGWCLCLGGLLLLMSLPVLVALPILTTGFTNAVSLTLPRAIGGILGGYFWLFVAAEPWYLALFAQRYAPWFWLVEWLLALLGTGYYLYREAFARVTQPDVAIKRSRKVLVLIVLEALVIGGFLTWLARPICQRVLSQKCDYRLLGVVPCWAFDYPIGALLTFAPLAIVLGITLQVLWLDQPITASVWQPDAR
jgi:hypothetical protein